MRSKRSTSLRGPRAKRGGTWQPEGSSTGGRKSNLTILGLIILLSSCYRNDPFIGRWTVERVNVDFNEQIATPEMVRQYGELEKGNIIEISKDSLLMFIADGDTMRGQCSLKGSQVLLDGKPFGRYENDLIQTEIPTPLGKVKVTYKRG